MELTNKTQLSSEWILKFYEGLEKHNIENHGLLIMKGNEIVFEEYNYPYGKDIPHTLFSVTKSIVSTATGFAIAEGLFTLDSEILPFFPEYKHCRSDEWRNITVRSLLTMQSNKKFTFTQDMTGNYTQMFMKAPFRKKDRGFLYSNNDVHVIAALIQKKTSMTLTEYLTPRLFEPLGIKIPEWETNSIGECIGGTGCYLTLRDVAKICRCYADSGRYNGVQVIDEEWTREATKIQIDFNREGASEGYGYLFWIKDGAFTMSGMFGQTITYFPAYDAVVASMNCAIEEGEHDKLINTVLTKAFTHEGSSEWDEKLQEYLAKRKIYPVVSGELPRVVTGKTFYLTPASDFLAKIMFPQSLLPRTITASLAKRPCKNLNRVSFSLTEKVLTIKWYEEDDEIIINCALDGEPRLSDCSIKGYKYTVWSYAYAQGDCVKAVVRPVNTLSAQYFTFSFPDNRLEMQVTGTPGFPEFIRRNVTKAAFIKNNPSAGKYIVKLVDKVLSTTEKKLIFRAK